MKRYEEIDILKGIAVICMVVFHFFYFLFLFKVIYDLLFFGASDSLAACILR